MLSACRSSYTLYKYLKVNIYFEVVNPLSLLCGGIEFEIEILLVVALLMAEPRDGKCIIP